MLVLPTTVTRRGCSADSAWRFQTGSGSRSNWLRTQPRYASRTPPTTTWAYPTSVAPVIQLAIWADGVVGSSDTFDIRLLGVIWAVVFGVVAGLAVWVTPGKLWLRMALVLLTFALWVDIGFVTYLTSYFSDSAMFAGAAALIVVVIHHARLEQHRLWHYVVFVAVVIFAITSKPLLLFAVLPASLVLLVMPWLTGRLSWRTMVLPVVAVGVMFIAAYNYLGNDGANYAAINEYNSLFFGILAESSDPAADLEEMGSARLGGLVRRANTSSGRMETLRIIRTTEPCKGS